MSAGTGAIKQVAAFRGAASGKAGLPPQGSDPSSINLDLVNGVANPNDTVAALILPTPSRLPPSSVSFVRDYFFIGACLLDPTLSSMVFWNTYLALSFHLQAFTRMLKVSLGKNLWPDALSKAGRGERVGQGGRKQCMSGVENVQLSKEGRMSG